MIQAVLFDFGDTLFQRRGGHDALVRAARHLGHAVDEDAARRVWTEIQLRARTPEELARGRDLSAEAHKACWTDLYKAAEVLAPGVAPLLYEYEVDAGSWDPYPDTVPLLQELHERGVPIGVVSDTGFDIRPVFERAGVLDCIGTFVLSYEQGAAKPTAWLFEAACRALDVEPAHTVMVGDNPLSDGGAVAAGLPTLLLPPARPNEPRNLTPVLRLVDRGAHTNPD